METCTDYCKFNRMINCDTKACKNCGWCPEVKEKRINEWLKNRANNHTNG